MKENKTKQFSIDCVLERGFFGPVWELLDQKNCYSFAVSGSCKITVFGVLCNDAVIHKLNLHNCEFGQKARFTFEENEKGLISFKVDRHSPMDGEWKFRSGSSKWKEIYANLNLLLWKHFKKEFVNCNIYMELIGE